MSLLLLAAPAAADEWKFDVLRLKNGATFTGLVVEETPSQVRFRHVRRRPGAPTVIIPSTFPRAEIARIDRLDAQERVLLQERLQGLDPTGKGEAARMEDIQLQTVPWLRNDGSAALRYPSAHFTLVSNAREDIVRRCAVRLEQIYGAYARFLPPRYPDAQPTTIVLVRCLAEYRTLLQDEGRNFQNPAFFDARRNQVVCASQLQDLGDELERARQYHQRILEQLSAEEAKLKTQFKGTVPPALRNNLAAKRRQIQQANLKNDAIFHNATGQLFRTLYHEAFHAYLANFVYPPQEADVPRWLNEGLAQIFETAIVEAGELRVGHVDTARLTNIRAAARKDEWLALTDLLGSGPKQFLVAHASDRQVSDRHYLNAWALAFYLTFDLKLLGSPALHEYVQSRKRGTPESEAFRTLVGEPVPQFENRYRQFLRNLRSDGTSPPAKPAKAKVP